MHKKTMEPKFEKFKKLEATLEKIPTIKPEAHFMLDDISAKIIKGADLEQKEIDFLETVWTELQDLDKDLVSYLNEHRSNDVISRNENLITADYFLISKQIGPESEKLREAIYEKISNIDEFAKIANDVSIPENTRQIIFDVYKKIIKSI